jgi:hypothetical protein
MLNVDADQGGDRQALLLRVGANSASISPASSPPYLALSCGRDFQRNG